MKEKIIDCFLEKLMTKSDCPNDVFEDTVLISSIENYIEEKKLLSRFSNSGISEDMLPTWIEMYYAPVSSLPFNEARNWFVNRELHKKIESYISYFRSYSDSPDRSKEMTAKIIKDIMNLSAPLAGNPDYALYLEEVRVMLKSIAARADQNS